MNDRSIKLHYEPFISVNILRSSKTYNSDWHTYSETPDGQPPDIPDKTCHWRNEREAFALVSLGHPSKTQIKAFQKLHQSSSFPFVLLCFLAGAIQQSSKIQITKRDSSLHARLPLIPSDLMAEANVMKFSSAKSFLESVSISAWTCCFEPILPG